MTGPALERDGFERASRWLLVALCGLSPLVVLPGSYDPANLPQATFVEIGAVGLLLAWAAGGAREGTFRVPRSPLLAPLLALLGWAGLSLIWADNRYEGAVTLMHWSACGAIFVLGSGLLRRDAALAAVSAALFGAGTLAALLGVLQHLFQVDWVPQAFPPAATFANKNMAAQFVVMALPFGLATARGVIPTALTGAGALLMLSYLGFAHSRAAWVALVVAGLAVVAAGSRGRRRARTALILSAVLAAGLAAGWAAGLADDVATAMREAPDADASASVVSLRVRIAVARNTLAMVRDAPWLGVGLGNHPLHYPEYARSAAVDPMAERRLDLDHAHNDYLQLAAELGLAGMGLALWLAWRLLGSVLESRQGWESLRTRAAIAAAGSLAAGFALAAFSFPAHRAIPPLLAAVGAAVLSSTRRRAGSAPGDDVALHWPGPLRLAAPLASGVALVAVSAIGGRWIASDRHCNRMRAAEEREDWAGAASEAAEARRLNPWRHEPALTLGTAALIGGHLERAIDELEAALEMRPRDAAVLANLGQACERADRTREALGHYRRLVALRPAEAGIHHRMGRILAGAGDGEAALESFRLAARHRPDAASFQLQLGLAAMQRRHFDEAERALARAVELDASLSNAHKALGVIRLENGRSGEAVASFRAALALKPDDKDAAQMRRIVEGFEAGDEGR
jgi:Flp pilus assembly protein TadD/O-antigen ligase